jgi:hypothetical protein
MDKEYSAEDKCVIRQIAATLEFADKFLKLPPWKPGMPEFDIYGTNIGYSDYMSKIQSRIDKMCKNCLYSLYHKDQWIKDGVEVSFEEADKYFDHETGFPKNVYGIPAHRTCEKVKEIGSCYNYDNVVKLCPLIDEKDKIDFKFFVEN